MLLREVPLYRLWYRIRLSWAFNDRSYDALQKDPTWPHPERSLNPINEGHRRALTRYIEDEVGDRVDLLAHVIPDYPRLPELLLPLRPQHPVRSRGLAHLRRRATNALRAIDSRSNGRGRSDIGRGSSRCARCLQRARRSCAPSDDLDASRNGHVLPKLEGKSGCQQPVPNRRCLEIHRGCQHRRLRVLHTRTRRCSHIRVL